MSHSEPVRILMVDDSDSDTALLRDSIVRVDGFHHHFLRVERLADGLDQIRKQSFDVVLLDLGLPDSQGVDTFVEFHERRPQIPVIVLTALNDEAVALEAMKKGAQDFLVKSQVTPSLLGRAVRYAIERHRSQAEVVHSRLQLRRLAAHLQVAREAERTHIAREVHDELGQLLTGLKMDLRWIREKLVKPGEAKPVQDVEERLTEAENMADATISAVQRIALELRPSALDNLGLGEAIRGEARRFEVRTGTPVRVALDSETGRGTPDTNTALFRVFQELLTNVARHARAGSVDVRLFEDDPDLVLVVADDGVGMDVDNPERPDSLGLLSMIERVQSQGGRMEFDSAPGRGTRAEIRVPCGQAMASYVC